MSNMDKKPSTTSRGLPLNESGTRTNLTQSVERLGSKKPPKSK